MSLDILGKLFGSAARVKIIRLFLMNFDDAFSPEEIATRSKCNPQVSKKELALLSSAGLIKTKKVLKNKKKINGWMLNSSFPYLVQLRNLLVNTEYLEKKDLISRFKNIGKIKLLIVSGVFVQDEDNKADMFLVVDGFKKSAFDQAIKTIESEIGKEICYIIFDTKEFLYRMDMYDKLICDMVESPHKKIIDTFNLTAPLVRFTGVEGK